MGKRKKQSYIAYQIDKEYQQRKKYEERKEKQSNESETTKIL